ncbi:MAG: hypothetical protein WC494_02495 [Candidatus Pacearchaeota archaeon]
MKNEKRISRPRKIKRLELIDWLAHSLGEGSGFKITPEQVSYHLRLRGFRLDEEAPQNPSRGVSFVRDGLSVEVLSHDCELDGLGSVKYVYPYASVVFRGPNYTRRVDFDGK